MTKQRGGLLQIFGFLFLVIVVAFFYLSDAFSKTVVKKTGECTREVTVNIEIYSGGPKWTDEELDGLTPKQKKRLKDMMDNYTSYSEAELTEIGEEWAGEIEDLWNGPTWEQVQNAREELGITEAELDDAVQDNAAGRAAIVKKVNDYLEQFGGSPDSAKCTEINCCKIYFKVNVKVRKYSDKADPDYHQIRVMKKGWRSSITRHGEGLDHNQEGTSGKLAYDPDNRNDASAGHETGHLMGLGDEYTDEGGTKEGHEHDIMDWSYGFPQEDALQKILKLGGAECDCCPRVTTGGSYTDGYYQDYGMTSMVAGDAILTNNCPHLKATKTKYENMLRNMALDSGLSVTARADLVTKINRQLKGINKALEDCDKPRPVTGTTGPETAIGLGEDLIPTPPFSYDSLECTTYGGGTVELPTFELDPPGSTPETPGTTPGSTPETPGTTPGSTPEIPVGPQTPASGTGDPGDVVVPENFGTITGEVIVPFGPAEYDDGSTWFPEADDGIIITPYDQTTTTTETPEDEEEPPEDQTVPESWYIFKVEQDVLQSDGTIEKGPAEKTVLKLGYPVPDKPGAGAVRTAEDTNNGSSAEPRFVETDDDGIGKIPIFVDGFESGDTSSWSEYGRPEDSEIKNTNPPTYVTGFTLDATPRKSRIVYLKAGTTDDTPPAVDIQSPSSGTTGTPVPVEHDLKDQESGGADIEPGFSTDEGQPFTPTPAQGGDPSESDDLVPTPAQGGDKPKEGEDDDPPTDQTELPDSVKPYVTDSVQFGTTLGVTLSYKYHLEDEILVELDDYFTEDNRYLKEKMDDPYYESVGTWGQPYDDQWAIKSVGFTDDENGAWAAAGDDLEPVIVAFIDSGIDWNHADISWDNIWINEDEIAGNGIDDDYNGYIDDTIGWDFYTNSASPWDQDGHGTFTAGMVVATQNNGIGIAGINPAAKIMVLKALSDFGHTRASYVAKAIKYATDNGARVINLSIGGEHQTYLEQLAIKYAHDRGVVIVVAAGNEAIEISEYGFAPYPEVIAVASSDFEGKRVFFSNIGPEIDIAAPGLDVLSLRARMTDFMRHLKDVPYVAGSAYVGDDKRYFRSSGTSFSAPIITGIASLILSMNPELSNVEVKRMILNSARDVEIPGTDQFTGYGVVDAVAALNADPAFEIIANISSVAATQDEAGAFFVNVMGTANANEFAGASVQIGIGEAPTSWKEVGTVDGPVLSGALAKIEANEFRAAPTWTIRVVVTHANGRTREQWYVLQLG